MKAKFRILVDGTVSIDYDDVIGDRVEREFICPVEGGYVRERVGNGYRQVCERLSSGGSTLMVSNRKSLIDVIRSEYRAMRRNDNKYTSRYI